MRFPKSSDIPAGSVEPPPRISLVEREYVAGVGKVGDRLLILLDADRLMSGAEQEVIETTWDASTSGRIACIGMVTGTRNAFSYLQQDCNDNGAVTNTINNIVSNNTQANTYSAADTNGRGTGNISVGQGTSYFTFYWISPTELFVVNSDPAPTFSGIWQQQNVPLGSSAFSHQAFLGQVAYYSTGVGGSGAGGDASVGIENADGANSMTSRIDRDLAGAVQFLVRLAPTPSWASAG